MSIELLSYPAYLSVILLAVLLVWLVAMLIMHFFLPKTMLSTYFKEPYFSRAEIAIFSAFPFNFLKDIMFMRLAAWPSSGKKRGLTEAYKLAPLWFQRISKIAIWILLVTFPLMLVLIFSLSIVYWMLGY